MRGAPILFFLLLIEFALRAAGAGEAIPLGPATLGNSMADRVRYLEDPEHRLSADSLLRKDLSERFHTYSSKRRNIGFTSSSIWVEGRVRNEMEEQREFLLEASRSITNVLLLYLIEDGRVIDTLRAGDHIPYEERYVSSRRNVLPFQLAPGEERRFILELRSHGESLVFPLIFWTPDRFFAHSRVEQMHHGFFYGIFFFVILIFSFFYKMLRDRTFLYYVLYIFCFGLLQFSIDGYSYRFFFPDAPWMADKIILFSSSLTILMLMLYARSFLKVVERSVRLDRFFKGFIGLSLLLLFLSFFPNSIARYCNPALNSFSFIAVLFVLISILYLKKHGLRVSNYFMSAYLLLIAGAIIFILGNTGVLESSPVTLNALKYGGLGEVLFLSFSMAEKYRSIQKEKELARAESLERMKELNRVKDEHNRELEEQVRQRTRELETEREKLAVINQEMTSSIRYAERIQRAIIPSEEKFDQLFKEHFVLYKPRDIVSGDMYWCSATSEGEKEQEVPSEKSEELAFSSLSTDPVPRRPKELLFAVMDCTGHGVPGAFLTFLGQSILTQAKKDPRIGTPAEALAFMDQELKRTLSQIQDGTRVQDGMDMSLCSLDPERMELHFAGANCDCYIVRDGEPIVLRGDRKGIGGEQEELKAFSDQTFELEPGDLIHLFSDGYPDQFGGPNNKKFKYKPFRELLASLHDRPLAEQKEELERNFNEWKGELEQVDDICVMGIRV